MPHAKGGLRRSDWGVVRGLGPLLLFLLLALLLALAALPARAAQPLVLGHQFPQGSIPDRAAQKFAQLVAEKSGGTLQIAVHAGGAFGDEREHLALLKRQVLDFAVTGDLVISSLSERYMVLNIPFIYRSAAHALASYDGALGQSMRAELQARGLVALAWHHVGVRMLTADRPITNLRDLQGLNLRLPQDTAWIAAWKALGAEPRHIQFTELPMALKMGRVNAQENPPNFIRSAKLYEHQKYLMTTAHMPQRQFIFASEGRWRQLSAPARKLIQEAAREAARHAITIATDENRQDLQWLLGEGGMTLVNFDPTGVREALAPIPQALAGEAGVAVMRQIQSTR